MNRERLVALALVATVLLVLFGGCRSTRVVEVAGEAPGPSVVTEADTVFLASPPDTVFLPPDTVRVTETVPYEVVRYLTPRPDTSRAYLLWHLSIDGDRVEVSGAESDLSFRAPVSGEMLHLDGKGPGLLDGWIEGEPVAPPVQRIECPGCAEPLIERSIRGWLTVIGLLFMGAAAGAIAMAVVKSA